MHGDSPVISPPRKATARSSATLTTVLTPDGLAVAPPPRWWAPRPGEPGFRLARVRIVSLLPSTTEILFAIGVGDEVVGVTFECNFPPEARSRPIVSSSSLPAGLSPRQIDAEVRARLAAGEDLYRLDEGALRDLAPDLVVTQDLCAVCAVDVDTVDAALEHLGCDGNVLTVDPATLAEVLESIVVIGAATGRGDGAARVVADLRSRLSAVKGAVRGRQRPKVAVVEWTDPLFSAGHWVPDMVEAAGGISVLGVSGQRSEMIRPERLAESRRGRCRRRSLRLQPGRGERARRRSSWNRPNCHLGRPCGRWTRTPPLFAPALVSLTGSRLWPPFAIPRF